MSRDYKPKTKKSGGGSPFLSGLLFGFLLGVVAAVALTIYIKGDTSPFEDKKINAPQIEALPEKPTSEQASAEESLDFYNILPETESTVTVKEIIEKPIKTKKENYYLQVGSFKEVGDADNLKAKLALLGFEAVVQTAKIPDKGTWHRVRVGPLNNIDSINKTRAGLTSNSITSDLIKVKK